MCSPKRPVRRSADGAGQNLVPENAGRLRIGDAVEILEIGEPNVTIVEAAAMA